MTRFKDTREKKSKEQKLLDKIEATINSMKNNKGPYVINRAMKRAMSSHKKTPYVKTDEDLERMAQQREEINKILTNRQARRLDKI